MNYIPSFCLDLEPDDNVRIQNEWPFGSSYLSMAQHQAFYHRQQQEHPSTQQQPVPDHFTVPLVAADDWGLTQALLDTSSLSPSSMSSLSSGLTFPAVTLDVPDLDPYGDLPATPSAGYTTSATPSSKPSTLVTSKTCLTFSNIFSNLDFFGLGKLNMLEDPTSPSDQLGLGTGAGRESSTSRRTSPGKEKASSPEQDVSSTSKVAEPKQHEFITAAHPSQFKDKMNMKKVRSRVMTDYVKKNESRRTAPTPNRPSSKPGRPKKARTSSGEPTSFPRPSITSAPDYSRISPPSSLPLQTIPLYAANPFSPTSLIVHSPSSKSASSSDSDTSLTHKQIVHRRYQQALDLLLGQRSPSGLWNRPELIELATQHFFDKEQQSPTPLRNFLGTRLDAFRTMPQASSRRVNVMRLKFSCTTTSYFPFFDRSFIITNILVGAKFFGTKSMGASWVPAMLHNRLAFLSTLCIAAAHEDAMHLRATDSDEMTAIKTEVTHLMIYEMRSVDNLEIMAILELLCSEIIRTGADESQLYMHSQSIMKFVKQKGGLENLGLKGDLAKFLTT